jgi:hypothetical protein
MISCDSKGLPVKQAEIPQVHVFHGSAEIH